MQKESKDNLGFRFWGLGFKVYRVQGAWDNQRLRNQGTSLDFFQPKLGYFNTPRLDCFEHPVFSRSMYDHVYSLTTK